MSDAETRRFAGAAGVAVLIVDALYLQYVLVGQGIAPPWPMRVALIGMWIAVSGICAIAGAALPGLRPPRRALLLGVAAAGLLVIGVVAGFSIGIALLIAAIAVVAAASTTAMRAGIGLGRQALSLMLLLAAAAALMGIGLATT